MSGGKKGPVGKLTPDLDYLLKIEETNPNALASRHALEAATRGVAAGRDPRAAGVRAAALAEAARRPQSAAAAEYAAMQEEALRNVRTAADKEKARVREKEKRNKAEAAAAAAAFSAAAAGAGARDPRNAGIRPLPKGRAAAAARNTASTSAVHHFPSSTLAQPQKKKSIRAGLNAISAGAAAPAPAPAPASVPAAARAGAGSTRAIYVPNSDEESTAAVYAGTPIAAKIPVAAAARPPAAPGRPVAAAAAAAAGGAGTSAPMRLPAVAAPVLSVPMPPSGAARRVAKAVTFGNMIGIHPNLPKGWEERRNTTSGKLFFVKRNPDGSWKSQWKRPDSNELLTPSHKMIHDEQQQLFAHYIQTGDDANMIELLSNGILRVNARHFETGQTLLFLAAGVGSINGVYYLLQAGADVDVQEKDASGVRHTIRDFAAAGAFKPQINQMILAQPAKQKGGSRRALRAHRTQRNTRKV